MSLTIGRLHQLTLALTVIVAALSVVSGSTLTAAASVVLIVATIAALPSIHDIDRSKLRTRIVHGVTLVLLAYTVLVARTATIDAVLLVVMLGIFNRFTLRGGHRDDFLIAGASTVLFAAATTITPGVLFLFLLVAFTPALLWALWASMILGAAENSAVDPKDVKSRIAAVRSMAQRRAPKQLGFIAANGIALMAIGYASVSILPRYYFMSFLGAGAFMTLPGGPPTMELRTDGVTDLDSSAVVLRVEPYPGKPAAGLAGMYARTYVLDVFDGRSFSTPENDRSLFPLKLPIDKLSEAHSESDFDADDDEDTVRVTLNRISPDNGRHPLATLGRAGPSEIVKRYVRQSSSGTWTAASFRGAAVTYKVRVGKRFDPPVYARQHVERQKKVLTQVPEGLDPRVIELAKRLTEGKETDDAKIDAVLQHFTRGFTYSLEKLEGESKDPLVRFLFEAKAGHCELYAGAVAMLLRVAGVKARVATGYYNGTWNDLGGYLAFTQADAHAWVEAYVEGEGWRWVDATPEDMRAMRNRGVLAFLRDWYDAAEAYWFDNVLDFDEEKRRALMDRISKRVKAAADEATAAVDEGQDAVAQGGTMTTIAVAGALGLLVAIPLALVLVMRRKARRRPESIGLRLRTALGEKEGENVTLGALLARVPEPVKPDAKKCVALYEEMRFGPPDAGIDPAIVDRAVADLARAVRDAR